MAESSREGDGQAGAERSVEYTKLLEHGLGKTIAVKLDDIFKTGKLVYKDLDDRALDALKEFPSEGALSVLNQFLESNLEHVSNKSAFLCGIMKTYRQKSRMAGAAALVPYCSSPPLVKGPDEEKIKAILERTGYSLDVTTGQRKYGGPPPGWNDPLPGTGCEVFCGKIPKDIYEDELIVLFEKCGTIWDLRLMMDPLSGTNRGYAFVTYTSGEEADRATRELDNYEIKPGKNLKVNISEPNLRLFVGNIPKSKSKEEIQDEFNKLTPGISAVIIYSSPDDNKKNRGFCFLEYESHKAASLGKKRLGTGRLKVWGCDIIVDWADPQEEPDNETMSKVKVLYVRNLTQYCTEEKLKEAFEAFGPVERVKRIKDYAFVHCETREMAVAAMNNLNGKAIAGSKMEISLAKPPSDKKKKEEILRARERRMLQMMQGRGTGSFSPQHPGLLGGPLLRGPSVGRSVSLPMQPALSARMGRGDYNSHYESACYDLDGYLSGSSPSYSMSPLEDEPMQTLLTFDAPTFQTNILYDNRDQIEEYENDDVEDEELKIMKEQLKSFSKPRTKFLDVTKSSSRSKSPNSVRSRSQKSDRKQNSSSVRSHNSRHSNDSNYSRKSYHSCSKRFETPIEDYCYFNGKYLNEWKTYDRHFSAEFQAYHRHTSKDRKYFKRHFSREQTSYCNGSKTQNDHCKISCDQNANPNRVDREDTTTSSPPILCSSIVKSSKKYKAKKSVKFSELDNVSNCKENKSSKFSESDNISNLVTSHDEEKNKEVRKSESCENLTKNEMSDIVCHQSEERRYTPPRMSFAFLKNHK